jgi:hypothetical protein
MGCGRRCGVLVSSVSVHGDGQCDVGGGQRGGWAREKSDEAGRLEGSRLDIEKCWMVMDEWEASHGVGGSMCHIYLAVSGLLPQSSPRGAKTWQLGPLLAGGAKSIPASCA